MKKPKRADITDVRMLTTEQGQAYTGMGRSSFRDYCDRIGATRHFGRSVRYDKRIIDGALDAMATE